MKTRTLGLAILLLGSAGIASADQDDRHRDADKSHQWFHRRGLPTLQAPEIDPASMVAALTLLGGALAVLRGRRAMKPKG
jgi:hypothetical protein